MLVNTYVFFRFQRCRLVIDYDHSHDSKPQAVEFASELSLGSAHVGAAALGCPVERSSTVSSSRPAN